jgi:hypothetical protein
MNTNELHLAADWMGRALAVAALLGMSACGSVAVETLGTGGAGSTGVSTGAGGVGTGPATTGVTTTTSSGVTTTTSSGVTTSSSSGGSCSPQCGYMLTCCDGTCAETDNDLLNCGGCGVVCPGAHPYCHHGVCEPEPACSAPPPCPAGDFCCGAQCCAPDEICCDTYGGPPQPSPRCEKPTNGTCQHSCFLCN